MKKHHAICFALLLLANAPAAAQTVTCTSTIPEGYTASEKYPVVFLLPATGGGVPEVPSEINGKKLILVEITGTESFAVNGFGKTVDSAERAILAELQRLKSNYNIDASNILLYGFSLGGDISFAIALKNPKTFTGVFVMGSRSNYRVKPETLKDATLRFYFTMGSLDDRKASMDKAREFITKSGLLSEFELIPDLEHQAAPPASRLKGLQYLVRGGK